MDVILRCPATAPAVPALGRRRPLVLTPFLGQTVLEHALAGLASEGVRRVQIEATDRLAEIESVVARGEAWGLAVTFAPTNAGGEPVPEPSVRVIELDRLPQWPQQTLWSSYRDWYAAQQALLPVMASSRVGMRESGPGVFVGLRSQVAPDARLVGACWIGANVFIGARANLGLGTIVEDGCYVDEGAELAGCVVGPQTYVGAYTELRDSFAWGSELLQLDTGSLIQVSDHFLLGEVRPKPKVLGKLRRVFQRDRGRDTTAERPPGIQPPAGS